MDEAHKELVRKIRAAEWHGDDDEITSLPEQAADALEALAGEVAWLQNTFDLMWKADQRAIKLWQEATGKDHIWPDRAKTTLWLLERAEAAEAERDRLKAALEGIGRQHLITEMSDEDLDGAIEEGYDQCILTARKAIGGDA